MPLEIAASEPDPIETALLEWIASADLYQDGVLVRTGVNLLGGNEAASKSYAHSVAAHLAENGTDREELIRHLLDPERGAKSVRAYGLAPQIAEGILAMLDHRKLLQ